jgi:hypothetical protein
MIDGVGDPNTSALFHGAIEALFSVSYTMKFMVRDQQGIDYGVMPLEGLWWMDDMREFTLENKDRWLWTVMIMQPEYVTEELVTDAIIQVTKKKGLSGLSRLRFDTYQEGLSAQVLHVGPFTNEGPTVATLHDFIAANGYRLHGKHHEIYLSDTRRAAPERWKTIIRQPITR